MQRGINVGDIIVEGRDIFGDGVNIAARTEGIAEPGGISISEDALRLVQGKVAAKFVNDGEHSLKNISRPARIYRVELGGEGATQPAALAAVALPDKPSIAVLPFTNMSGDAEQDYFCDGLVEDIGGEAAYAGIGCGLAMCQNWFDGIRTGRRMLPRLMVIAMTLLSGFAGGHAAAQEAIGAISRIQGEASGTLGGATRALGLNASVFLNEVVSTGEAARLEVTFTDNTRLTLGEKAKLTLDTYVFDPAAGSGTIKFGVVGPLRFLSGQVSKLASSDVSVTTAVATLGIRGTEFWGGPIDDQALGVFLIEGALSVSNATGEQILRQPGQGTNIAAPGSAPGPVTFWPQAKVNRAIATVTFR